MKARPLSIPSIRQSLLNDANQQQQRNTPPQPSPPPPKKTPPKKNTYNMSNIDPPSFLHLHPLLRSPMSEQITHRLGNLNFARRRPTLLGHRGRRSEGNARSVLVASRAEGRQHLGKMNDDARENGKRDAKGGGRRKKKRGEGKMGYCLEPPLQQQSLLRTRG